jgi:hypothetical protein
MRHYHLTLLFIFISAYAQAQGLFGMNNVLRFNQRDITGTARMQGLAGTGVSLGGDLSAAHINPAGLGFYNRSQFSGSLGLQSYRTDAAIQGDNTSNSYVGLSLPSLGVVFNKMKDDIYPGAWRGGSFSIAVNRTADYRREFNFTAENDVLSIIDNFAVAAEGIPPSSLDNDFNRQPPFIDEPVAAFFNYLINPANDDGSFYLASIPAEALTNREGYFEEGGRQTEWNLAYGGNFEDRFYLGASIGITDVDYSRTRTITERYNYSEFNGNTFFPFGPGPENTSIAEVERVFYEDDLRITATGFNASVGFIARPVTPLTIGINYQTPTLYLVSRAEEFVLESDVFGVQFTDQDDPIDLFGDDSRLESTLFEDEYTFTAPSRFSAGATVFFQKYGFITGDVTLVNYANSRFNSSSFTTDSENETVQDSFGRVFNYNLGAELRYDIFRLRAGYRFEDDPTSGGVFSPAGNAPVPNRSRTSITGGAGLYFPNVFVDIAVIRSQIESDFQLYFDEPFTANEQTSIRGVVTVGFNF